MYHNPSAQETYIVPSIPPFSRNLNVLYYVFLPAKRFLAGGLGIYCITCIYLQRENNSDYDVVMSMDISDTRLIRPGNSRGRPVLEFIFSFIPRGD